MQARLAKGNRRADDLNRDGRAGVIIDVDLPQTVGFHSVAHDDHAEVDALLHKLPMLQTKLAELPEELQRELFTAFRLEIRYDACLGVALIRITLDHETIEGAAAMAEELPGNENRRLPETGACAEDLMSAPGRIRTCGTRFRSAEAITPAQVA
ncbi:hypothetical protein [Microbispora sp. CA-102843]|uniref:hypothetical protein n=1 Tax=Microbispora sp. CA-102843 TaxID=3239952 RepID=UPI003D941579